MRRLSTSPSRLGRCWTLSARPHRRVTCHWL